MVILMVNQKIFPVLALIAGLVIGVGVGYLANYSQVNSLGNDNGMLRYQISVLQDNLTSVNASYNTLWAIYNATKSSYQSLSLQYSNLVLEQNALEAQMREANATINYLDNEVLQMANTIVQLRTSTYNATFLPDQTYSAQVLSTLGSANSSVYVVMYGMSYETNSTNSTANSLISALVAAKGRGVNVKVVLDDYTLDQYPDTITYLENNSVSLLLDPSNSTTTHSNLVIVDGKIAFIGSEDWTEAGLTNNNEYAVMLRGNMTSVTSYFTNLWNSGRAP